MHRLPSAYSVIRFRLASWLLLVLALLIVPTLGIVVYSLVVTDREFLLVALKLIGLSMLLAILQWAVSTRARCPLCHTRAIAHNSCARHRNARRLFGSYRLRMASTIIFKGSFRCPYCGELTMIKSRATSLSRRRS